MNKQQQHNPEAREKHSRQNKTAAPYRRDPGVSFPTVTIQDRGAADDVQALLASNPT